MQSSVPVVRDGPLAEAFRDGTKLLQPLVFSHGLTSHKMNYSGLCREFASYGFLVIALNHNDHSCEFTTGKEVKDIDAKGNSKQQESVYISTETSAWPTTRFDTNKSSLAIKK